MTLELSHDLLLFYSDFLGFLHRNQELAGPDYPKEEVDYLRMAVDANNRRGKQLLSCETAARGLLTVYQGLRNRVLSRQGRHVISFAPWVIICFGVR